MQGHTVFYYFFAVIVVVHFLLALLMEVLILERNENMKLIKDSFCQAKGKLQWQKIMCVFVFFVCIYFCSLFSISSYQNLKFMCRFSRRRWFMEGSSDSILECYLLLFFLTFTFLHNIRVHTHTQFIKL